MIATSSTRVGSLIFVETLELVTNVDYIYEMNAMAERYVLSLLCLHRSVTGLDTGFCGTGSV